MPIIDLIQFRRGIASLWTSVNTLLSAGEPGFETDKYRLKVGNGTQPWNSLLYLAGSGVPAILGGTGISVFTGVGSVGSQYYNEPNVPFYVINNTGVISISGGSGISVTGSGGYYTITNTGIISISGGSGISVTGSGGYYTITNTGVISISGGSGISVTGSDGYYSIINTISISGGSGISVTESGGYYTITNTGVISISGGNGIDISGSGFGNYTIINTGVLSVSGGPGINITGANGYYTVINNGVIDISPGYGIKIEDSNGYYTVFNTGVISISGGPGIEVSGSGGDYTITNTGVLNISPGYGISVSGLDGDYTVTNTGIVSLSEGPGIGITGSNGDYTIFNNGVIAVFAGTGISVTGSDGYYTVINTGVISIFGGNGIDISGSDFGNYTIINTGVLSIAAGSGIQALNYDGNYIISNTGVVDISGGNGINITENNNIYTIEATGFSLVNHIHTASNITDFNSAVSGLLTGYSISGHTHTASNITDFNSAVSGLLPVKNVLAGTGISISSSSGIYTITSTGSGVNADSATQTASVVTTVFNKTASTIPKMSAVYINGGQGDQPTIQLAIATRDTTSAGTYGLTFEPISSMSAGKVIVFGALVGVNTDQFNPTAPTGDINGSILYLSPTTSGTLTTIKPSAPNHIVAIGTVVRTHQNAGVIEVRVQNGFELDELHNVAITGATNGQFLQYNSTSGLWIPSSSGNFSTLQLNGTTVSVSGHTHTASQITDFNEAVDDRIGSGLFVAGTGINLNYNDSGNSFTISVTGLISNPLDTRLLTSRNSTTVGIDAESALTFDGSILKIDDPTDSYAASLELHNDANGDGSVSVRLLNASGIEQIRIYSNDDADQNFIDSYGYPLYIASYSDRLYLGGPSSNYIDLNISSGIDIGAPSGINILNNLKINNQIANTIASFDINKNIVSLATGTYPNLTELTYVKGVTSAIQTQLNNKQNSLTNPITGTGTTNYISKWTSSSGLNNSNIYDDGTNIGVGTTTPSGQLHVIGTGIFSNRVGINTNAPGTQLDVAPATNTDGLRIKHQSNNYNLLQFVKSDNSNILRQTYDGSDTLYTYYNLPNNYHMLGSSGNILLYGGGAGNYHGLWLINGVPLIINNTNGTYATAGASIWDGGYNYATSGTQLTSVTPLALTTYSWNGSNGYTIRTDAYLRMSQLSAANNSAKLSLVRSSDNKEILTVNFSGNGNIGIGTSTPSGQLHVIGSGIFASGINIPNQTASTIAAFDSAKSIVSLSTATYPSLTELVYVKGVTSDIQTQLNGKSNTGHTHSGMDINIDDLGLTHFSTADNLDNVFYNIDSAFYTVYNNFSSYQPLLTNPITSSAGGTAGYIPKFTNSTNIANSLIYDNGTRIGIGTTSPQQLVHISGNFISAGNILRLQNGNPALRTFVDFRIGSTGNYEDHFFISRSGNDVFGIDTSNRGLFLGNFTQLATKQFQSYNNANAFIEMQQAASPASSANTRIGFISDANLIFLASYVERMRLTGNGRLGIGTNSPGASLHVNGSGIIASGLTVSGVFTASTGTITTLSTIPTYVSPSALSSSQGDWNPGAGDVIRISASTSGVNISGILLGSEYTRVLINVGTTHNITLKHQATSATATNRIITPIGGDYIIQPTGSATLLYDTIDSRWRVL